MPVPTDSPEAVDSVRSRPLVSILLCAYKNEATVERSLKGFLAQTYQPIEIIMVDSSPDHAVARIVHDSFPQIHFVHHKHQLLANEAHAVAVEYARGDLLLFSDPDIYAPATWVEDLVRGWEECPGPVSGSLACYGDRWWDMGLHLAKFDQWLPVGRRRTIEIGPTTVLLCTRAIYEQAGGFPGGSWLADTMFSWAVAELGHAITFLPHARVEHHHLTSLPQFLRQRFDRGREYGELRSQRGAWSRIRYFGMAFASLVGVRWLGLMMRSIVCAWPSDRRWDYLAGLPVVTLGHAAWLLGEAACYVSALFGTRQTSQV